MDMVTEFFTQSRSLASALNYNGTQTATMMGKVTDAGGNPVSGLLITGAQKPSAAGGANFTSAQTYSYDWTNPDDYYVENFATTDIAPGNYCLEANGSIYANLGCHDFVAGRTTYVGLYPAYLPDLRNEQNGWISHITIVNNSGTSYAQVVTTYFFSVGDPAAQRVDNIAPHAGITFDTPYNGAALIVGSQDLSVVVVHERSNPYYVTDTYAGVTSPATDVLVPLVHRANSGWNSDLFIQNTGNAHTLVSLEFLPRTGSYCNPCALNNFVLVGSHGREQVSIGGLTNLSYPFVGSVRVTADQPLAIASTQFNGNSQLMDTNNSQPPATEVYAPLIQNNNSGWLSGVTLSKIWPYGIFNLYYYRHNDGYLCYWQTGQTATPYVAYAAIPTPIPSGPNPCSSKTPSGIFQTGSAMVGNVNQLQGTTNATTYAAISSRGTTVIVPKFRRDAGWMDGFVIANPGSATANIEVRLYPANGSNPITLPGVSPLYAKRSVTIFSQGTIPLYFNGSAVVTSDQPIAVSANSYKPGSGDTIGSYPAIHR
jgi:hypothetical protein